MDRPLNILSLGAGVQSTALALMGERGELEIDHAIFADTQGEPKAVYKHLEWLQNEITKFPIHIVTAGNLEEDIFSGGRFASIPFFLRDKDGKIGMGRRQCTNEYKIQPVYKKTRELLGLKPYQRPVMPEGFNHCVNMIMGITLDEALRMRINPVKWIKNTYPFIDMRVTRQELMGWFENNGYPIPPKSACYFCPYHSLSFWKDMRKRWPDEFSRAVEFDSKLRHPTYVSKFRNEQYLHQAAVPLKEALSVSDAQLDFGFINECEGMCGV